MNKKKASQSTEFRVYSVLCFIFGLIYLCASIIEDSSLIFGVIGILVLYSFGAATNGIAYRKGYGDYFLYPFSLGFFFGIIALIYYAAIPPAWEHPEYINADHRYLDD